MGAPERKISRRDLLKWGSVALGGSLGGIFLGQEVSRFQDERVVTPSGVFYPLYENHYLGIRPEQIPSGIDLFWREMRWRTPEGQIYNFPQKEEDLARILRARVLSTLRERKVKLIFGDVSDEGLFPDFRRIEYSAVMGVLTSCMVFLISDKLKITRGQFLKKALIGTAVLESWVFSPWLFALGTNQLLKFNQEHNYSVFKAAERVWRRAASLSFHLHPELTFIFFRNAVWADKLLTTGEQERTRLGRLPRIAYNVGVGHAGVEDFLLAGKDFCRLVITSYPAFWLEKVVEENGGIKGFASACVVDLGKKSFDRQFVADGVLVKLLEEKLKIKA